jgi:O-methyltransferase
VLRLDGDLYESTMDSLSALYHKVSPGGYVIVDDLHIVNCLKAVQDFRERHRIEEPTQPIDDSSVYWQKRRG